MERDLILFGYLKSTAQHCNAHEETLRAKSELAGKSNNMHKKSNARRSLRLPERSIGDVLKTFLPARNCRLISVELRDGS
jgi:hypothetical protein